MNSRRFIIMNFPLACSASSQFAGRNVSILIDIAQAEASARILDRLGRRLDHASAMPAADDPDRQRDNQRAADHNQHPVVLAYPGMMRNSGVAVQRRYRQ